MPVLTLHPPSIRRPRSDSPARPDWHGATRRASCGEAAQIAGCSKGGPPALSVQSPGLTEPYSSLIPVHGLKVEPLGGPPPFIDRGAAALASQLVAVTTPALDERGGHGAGIGGGFATCDAGRRDSLWNQATSTSRPPIDAEAFGERAGVDLRRRSDAARPPQRGDFGWQRRRTCHGLAGLGDVTDLCRPATSRRCPIGATSRAA